MADRIEIKMDFSSQDIQRQLQRLKNANCRSQWRLRQPERQRLLRLRLRMKLIGYLTGPRRGFRTLLTFWPQRRVILQPLCMLVNGRNAPAPVTLTPQIEGGQRQYKRSEGALRAGGYLPNGCSLLLVPAQSWTNTGIFRGGNYSRSYLA
ncbi:Uncharacterised protein [Escherichia coli]|uniref:Uncharacterized protein n=1 Tax=Escherichia coli TaxID=562 RepID=A0A2X1LDP3_ECOLX|nr:Uncharacterised protein [Escherichia coli]